MSTPAYQEAKRAFHAARKVYEAILRTGEYTVESKRQAVLLLRRTEELYDRLRREADAEDR